MYQHQQLAEWESCTYTTLKFHALLWGSSSVAFIKLSRRSWVHKKSESSPRKKDLVIESSTEHRPRIPGPEVSIWPLDWMNPTTDTQKERKETGEHAWPFRAPLENCLSTKVATREPTQLRPGGDLQVPLNEPTRTPLKYTR